MILYNSDSWSCVLLWRVSGSVLPQAFSWGFSSTLLAAAIHLILIPRAASFGFHDEDRDGVLDFLQQMEGVPIVWAGFTAALGSLLAFRNSSAYRRFWEGASLVYMVRGEWFNAVSSLMSFCSTDTGLQAEVSHFQQLLVRLISLLHCSALQHVCEIAEDSLEVLDVSGIDTDYLEFLESVHDRCEMLIQWVQRLVVDAHRKKVLDISPPILSRCFQELSRGIVNLNNVRKIKDIPFPYPYNQLVIWMLVLHWLITPLLAGLFIHSSWWAMIVTFLTQSSLWALNFIAGQMDQPFGEDANDLPMAEMQQDFNKSLLALLQPEAQCVPPFHDDTVAGYGISQPQIKKASTQAFSESGRRTKGTRRLSVRSTPSAGNMSDACASEYSEASSASDVIIYKDNDPADCEGIHVAQREETKEEQELTLSNLGEMLAADSEFETGSQASGKHGTASQASGNSGVGAIPQSKQTMRLSGTKQNTGTQNMAAASENPTSTLEDARSSSKNSAGVQLAINSQEVTSWGKREESGSSQVPALASNPLSFKGRKIFNAEGRLPVKVDVTAKKKRQSQPPGFMRKSSMAVGLQDIRKSGTTKM